MDSNPMTRHGHYQRYNEGCRCDDCRHAHMLRMNKYRRKRTRNGAIITWHGMNGGHLTVPADQLQPQLARLHKQYSWPRLATLTGINLSTLSRIALGKRRYVYPATAQTIRDAYADLCEPSEHDRRTWPVKPFQDALIARYGSLNAAGDLNATRNTFRVTHIQTNTAETYCERHGWMPHEIWPDWYTKPNPEKETAA